VRIVRVSGFGFRVPDSGFRASGFGFRVSGFGFRVSGSGFRVSDFGFRVPGFGFRVLGLGLQVPGFGFSQGRKRAWNVSYVPILLDSGGKCTIDQSAWGKSTLSCMQGRREHLRRASEAFPIIEEAPPSPPLLYKDAEIGVRVPD